MAPPGDGAAEVARGEGRLWLEPDGRGGYAAATVAAGPASRAHGLLVVRAPHPVVRWNLVAHLDERLSAGGADVPLTTLLGDAAIATDGARRCVAFSAEPWPTWTYAAGDVHVVREVLCPRARGVTVVRWRLADPAPAGPARLRVRPLLAMRDFQARTRADGARFAPGVADLGGEAVWRPRPDLPAVHALHGGRYRHAPAWIRGVRHPHDATRGEPPTEDLWAPGELSFELAPGRDAWLVLGTEGLAGVSPDALVEEERRRRDAWAAAAPSDPLARRLWIGSDAYLVEEEGRAVVNAGYPWFATWGRDAFTALPGLCLATGRHAFARRVLEAFVPAIRDGLVPDVLPAGGGATTHHAIDAALWYVVSAGEYLRASGDAEGLRSAVWPAIRGILDAYRRGTRHGIRVDGDGLVTGGAPDTRLTWMDAKSGPRVFTPRHGKPVEVQAAWIRALARAAELARALGDAAEAARCAAEERTARASFARRFWYGAGGWLHDVLDGPGGDDPTLRPNQLFALATAPALVDADRARLALRAVRARLLVEGGVRSLPPDDPAYHGRYEGTQEERNAAYHQGTAWPFLLGPLAVAWLRVHGDDPAVRREARAILAPLEPLLDAGCVGHLPEILDGDPPHRTRGCFAQAWSAAEALWAFHEIEAGAAAP